MWWTRYNTDQSGGGFQNRDVGKTNFGSDFGPDFGIDYARFADPPNITVDTKLFVKINNKLFTNFAEDFDQLEILVRNGFVILKGNVSDEATKKMITEEVLELSGVKEVINHLKTRGNYLESDESRGY